MLIGIHQVLVAHQHIHPALGKGAVWFTRLNTIVVLICVLTGLFILQFTEDVFSPLSPHPLSRDS